LDGFIVNVEIVVVRDDRFLMIVRSGDEDFGGGWLTFPGGKLDWDGPCADALEATARRELVEEVGIDLVPPIIYVEAHTFNVDALQVLDVVFLARAGEGTHVAQDPAEVAAVQWRMFGEIMRDPRVQPWTRSSLERAVKKLHLLDPAP
jgi:8-oxo-dGTP diphosphatase